MWFGRTQCGDGGREGAGSSVRALAEAARCGQEPGAAGASCGERRRQAPAGPILCAALLLRFGGAEAAAGGLGEYDGGFAGHEFYVLAGVEGVGVVGVGDVLAVVALDAVGEVVAAELAGGDGGAQGVFG